jgi:hypothetical protein
MLLLSGIASASEIETFKVNDHNLACERDYVDILSKQVFAEKPKQWFINDLVRSGNCISIPRGQIVKLVDWKLNGKIIVMYKSKNYFLKTFAKK